MILFTNRFLSKPAGWFLASAFILLLGFVGITSLTASPQELERREARVQATYLAHLITFTRWSQDHLPKQGTSPKIVVHGSEQNGFVASLEYLISQSNIEIGGVSAQFIHHENAKSGNAMVEIKRGVQVVFIMPDSALDIKTIRKLSPSAVIFGFGRDFVTQGGGDVSFVASRNRVKLVLSENYFRRTSPKLSAKIANLKSVVEIIKNRSTRSSNE